MAPGCDHGQNGHDGLRYVVKIHIDMGAMVKPDFKRVQKALHRTLAPDGEDRGSAAQRQTRVDDGVATRRRTPLVDMKGAVV
jgi:hypothetical protein